MATTRRLPTQLASSPATVQFSMNDMQFFHHFLTISFPHLPLGNDDVWIRDIPQFAQEYTYLMHAILALGASHLNRTAPLACYEKEALIHRGHAINGLNTCMAKTSHAYGEADAMLATCYALTFQSSYMADGLSDFVIFVRGCALATGKIRDENAPTAFNLSPNRHHQVVRPRLPNLPAIDPAHLNRGISALDEIQVYLYHEAEHKFYIAMRDVFVSHQQSPGAGYLTFMNLYRVWYDLDHDAFRAFLDTGNTTIQILLGFFIGIQMIMAPLTACEWRERADSGGNQTLLGMADWMENVASRVPDELQWHLAWPRTIHEAPQTIHCYHARDDRKSARDTTIPYREAQRLGIQFTPSNRQAKQPGMNATLASSLLALENDHAHSAITAGGTKWQTGITSLDKELPSNIWSGGNVVGIGSIESSSIANLNISHELIVTHLIEQGSTTAKEGQENSQTVFIIAPASQAARLIQGIYSLLKARLVVVAQSRPGQHICQQRPASNSDPKALLNTVSIMPYLDAAGLLESLSEVSSILNSQARQPRRTIISIQGTTQTINHLQRRSGLVQAAALLSSAMYTLRNITRASRGLCLAVVEVDVSWGNPTAVASTANPAVNVSMNTAPSPSNVPLVKVSPLQTAFSSSTGKVLRIDLSNALTRVVEGEVDVFLVVHDADGKIDVRREERRILEVVKDERLGVGERTFGRWCIWNG
ncbi:hypothetical protein LTR51_006523 [Lithohypha guttulata]|nr:hypothetical protein LTR51_006523 [Lithohypha guttulata]